MSAAVRRVSEAEMRVVVRLSTAGPGIIFYSPFALAAVPAGENYLASSFTDSDQVADHLMRCDLSAFCTGSGGDYELYLTDEPLDDATLAGAEFKIRLGLEVRGGAVCFRDLFDLTSWSPNCPHAQTVSFADSFYRVTVYSSSPPSGILGDGQRIDLHFEKVNERPRLKWTGVPQLC